jgi:hypothetical protein
MIDLIGVTLLDQLRDKMRKASPNRNRIGACHPIETLYDLSKQTPEQK